MNNGPQGTDFVTRFAPSPTGPLHLGHAYSAMLGHDMARRSGGTFLLRIEDIDRSRSRPEWEAQIFDDLNWLGLRWPQPVLRQSDNMRIYAQALDHLWEEGLLYPCSCSRRDILDAVTAPQEGDPIGPDGIIYPGTCRPLAPPPGARPRNVALRLDMARALDRAGDISFLETGGGPQDGTFRVTADEMIREVGDVVLSRRDMGTSYHLSVVLDDAAQGITHVVRGQDLFGATAIHVLLQRLLDVPTPVYHHHHLIRDESGKRLAKRDDARAIAAYRAEGATPADIRRLVGL